MDVEKELQKGEKILHTYKPHPGSYVPAYVFVGILALMFFWLLAIPAIIVLVLVEGSRRGQTFVITNKRIIHHYAFIGKRIASTSFSRIQDSNYTQGLFQRIYDVGDISFNTAGTGIIGIRFHGVRNPSEVKKIIDSKTEKEKKSNL